MTKELTQQKLARITELRDKVPGGSKTQEYQDLMDQMLSEATGATWKGGVCFD